MVNTLPGTWATRPCPVRPLNDGCLAPMPGHWLALTAEGFVRITDDDQWLVGPVELPEETCEEAWDFPDGRPRRGLHTSRDGRFAAVVSEYGRFATVVDLDEWLTVVDLDRNPGDNEFTRFPWPSSAKARRRRWSGRRTGTAWTCSPCPAESC